MVLRRVTYNSVAAWGTSGDFLNSFPESGGLIQIDDEIIAYTARNSRDQSTGVIEFSANGRGLLNTEPRGHDRGARVKFLSQRPAAILAGSVGGSESCGCASGATRRRFGCGRGRAAPPPSLLPPPVTSDLNVQSGTR